MGSGLGYPDEWPAVSLETKHEAGWRCCRCGHPSAILVEGVRMAGLRPGDPPKMGIDGELAILLGVCSLTAEYPGPSSRVPLVWLRFDRLPCDEQCTHASPCTLEDIEAGYNPHRVLTVHHLDGVKANLAWWNLTPLCQRCHLQIQAIVKLDQIYMHPHSDWFLPYVAGYYAHRVLGESPTRAEVEADLARYLIAGQPHLADHYTRRLSGAASTGRRS